MNVKKLKGELDQKVWDRNGWTERVNGNPVRAQKPKWHNNLITYTKSNTMKPKPDFGAFHAIWQGNKLGLCYRSELTGLLHVTDNQLYSCDFKIKTI